MEYLYEKKDRKLILLSKIIDDYPSLKKFLQEHKRATDEDLLESSSDVQEIFSGKLFTELTLQARTEWKMVSEYPTLIIENPQKRDHECEYCGKKNLKYVYTIENEANGTRLNIGSKCVFDLGLKKEHERADFDKNAKRFYRQTLLNGHIPNIIATMDNIKKPLEDSPIAIPVSIQDKFLNSVEAVRHSYYEYIDPKTLEKDMPRVLEGLRNRLAAHELILNKLLQYITENQDNLLVFKKTYQPYIRDVSEAIQYVRQNGYINKLALMHITDASFMMRLIPTINEILLPCSISINAVKNKFYQFKYSERRELFQIDHSNLMLQIVEGIFDEPLPHELSVNGILGVSNFADEYSFLTGVRYFIGDTKYDCELSLEKDEIIFFLEKDREEILDSRGDKPNAILHRWSDFYRLFKRNILIREDIPRQQLSEHIYNNGFRIVYTHHQGLAYEIQRNPAKHS